MTLSKAPGSAITIHDIAAEAGVSKSTVSLVLKKSPLIKPETAAKVWKAAEKLGYVYNRMAANLRQKSSNVVGVIVNDLTNPFFVELLIGIERVLLQSGYITLMAHTAESAQVQEKVIASFREQNAAGILMCPAFGTSEEIIDRLREMHLPFVIMVRQLGDLNYDYVGAANTDGTRMATEHLLKLGHTRIGFIGRSQNSLVGLQRQSGYEDAMKQAGLDLNPSWIVDSPVSMQGGQDGAKVLLDMDKGPTAVVCYNDLVAMGVLNELDYRGLRAGKDMAVIGFDDIATAAHTNPPLTTLAINPEQQGEIASRMLLNQLRDHPATHNHYFSQPKLMVRESSGGMVAG